MLKIRWHPLPDMKNRDGRDCMLEIRWHPLPDTKNRMPNFSQYKFELSGKYYRKYERPREFTEYQIIQGVVVNKKIISATKFYSKLKEARKSNIKLELF